MTEQEAVEYWKEQKYIGRNAPNDYCNAVDCAIKALEEVQQYRALGTIEQIKTLQDDYWKLNEMCKEYSALGTVEELTEAKELYDVICKTEDDACRLGMGSKIEIREHIKDMARHLRGKV